MDNKYKLDVMKIGNKYYNKIFYPITSSDGRTTTECLFLTTDTPLSQEHYSLLVSTLIRKRYSADDEFAMDRQCYSDVDEYIEYNKYAERCKEIACEILKKEYLSNDKPSFAEIITQLYTFLQPNIDQVEDSVAVTIPALFPILKKNVETIEGKRYSFNGKLWRCLQSHVVQDGEIPDENSSLWEEITNN